MIPPDAISGTPGAVHHFACYRAKLPKGAAKPLAPAQLAVNDRFGSVTLALGKPTALCVPVDAGGDPLAASGPETARLLAGEAGTKHTPKPARRLDARASSGFGAHQLDVKSVAELCVPAIATP